MDGAKAGGYNGEDPALDPAKEENAAMRAARLEGQSLESLAVALQGLARGGGAEMQHPMGESESPSRRLGRGQVPQSYNPDRPSFGEPHRGPAVCRFG